MTRKPEKWVFFSTCDEDSESELRALEIGPQDDVLSVTGSGCRSLSLLSQAPRSLTTVDMDKGQNHLFRLKLAAIRTLDYGDLLGFLGVSPSRDRLSMFKSLEAHLPEVTFAYFRAHEDKISSGVIYSGRHEQFYRRLVAPLLRLVIGAPIEDVFECAGLDEQRAIYEQRIRSRLWVALIKHGFSERVLKAVFNNPGYHIHIDVKSPADYILSRVDHAFRNHDLKGSDWMSVTLRGRYGSALPHFLRPDVVARIRAAQTRITVEDLGINAFCRDAPPFAYDKIALSDVTSCISPEMFDSLITDIARITRPEGRLCYRNFLADYRLSGRDHLPFRRETALSSDLDHRDRAFIYRFEIGTRLLEAA